MPITYRIDSEKGFLYVLVGGAPTQDEILTAMQAWWNDPEFRPGLLTLIDGSDATSLPTLSQLEEIVGLIRRHAHEIGRKKLAIIAPRPVIFGVARQFGALAPGGLLTVRVFKDRDAGIAWLTESSS